MRLALVLMLAALAFVLGCAGPGDPEPRAVTGSGSTVETGPSPGGIRLVAVARGLDNPVHVAAAPGEPDRLYVVEQAGRIRIVQGGRVQAKPFLDVTTEVVSGGEQGLLSIAFHPEYRENGLLYVDYTDLSGDTRVVEYRALDDRTGVDPASRRVLLAIDQPYSNHNGGNLAFGPDGYLYIGLGDGGSAGDPEGRAQSLSTLLGKMLRIDPRPDGGEPYGIPPDNPFVGRDEALPEIWAYGLRNPWRYSFDRETGDLWIGDVGQGSREEIDFARAGSHGGENYAWDLLEGTLRFEGDAPPDDVPPVFEYPTADGCAVTGGYVYRGQDIPELIGAYVFADFCAGRLEAFRLENGEARDHDELGPEVANVASFGEDAEGELYVLSLSGPVSRFVPA
jgi:glucose/arabinose dehydrogenase